MSNPYHEFWQRENDDNRPEYYATLNPKRSRFLVDLVESLLHRPESVLEIGCNSGRNLNHLWDADFTALAGVDVRDCSETMDLHFPRLSGLFAWGPAEIALSTLPDSMFDLVFSMATLTHLPEAAFDSVSRHMARLSSRYVITIEDEERQDVGFRHPRNYQEVFESLGLWQIMRLQHTDIDDDIDYHYVTRVFTRK